jgi:hypothetical protein
MQSPSVNKSKRQKRHRRRGIILPDVEKIIETLAKEDGMILQYSKKQNNKMCVYALKSNPTSFKYIKIMTDQIYDNLKLINQPLVIHI